MLWRMGERSVLLRSVVNLILFWNWRVRVSVYRKRIFRGYLSLSLPPKRTLRKGGRGSGLQYVIISFINIRGKYTFRVRLGRGLNLPSAFRCLMRKKDLGKSMFLRGKF